MNWQSDGIFGFIYVDDVQKNIILAFRGIHPSFPNGPTPSQRDLLNENLMFSCCHGKISWFRTSYDCEALGKVPGGRGCYNDCMSTSSNFEESYYNIAQQFYPGAFVWTTGHSFGGSLASLVGLTYGVPAVTFESPGDLFFAHRIGLLPHQHPIDRSKPFPDYTSYLSQLQIYHIGNDRDPIYNGACVGTFVGCWRKGFVLETKCHTGKECLYDTADVKIYPRVRPKLRDYQKSIAPSFDIAYHSIDTLITKVIEPAVSVPECVVKKCEDCSEWTYLDE
ncbi:putative lipase atg15 [Nowakowskiella sp. JEL0407]|nr:putative lipase atg15 [Nowakowskiella sp. JEL0407]